MPTAPRYSFPAFTAKFSTEGQRKRCTHSRRCPSNTADTSQGPDPSPRLPGLGAHLNTHLSQFRQPQGPSSPITSPDRAGEQDRLDQGTQGQSSPFQNPPGATHSRLQKRYCFLGTAAELWPDTTATFSKTSQPLVIQIKAWRDFQRQLFGHLHTCIHQAPELLGHLKQVACSAAEAAMSPGSLGSIWSW